MNLWLTSEEKAGNEMKMKDNRSTIVLLRRGGGLQDFRKFTVWCLTLFLKENGEINVSIMEKNVRKFKFNAKFIYNNKPMKTMMDIRIHKCCDIRPVLPWGYTPWNKNVIKLPNLVVCEKILGIIVLMVAF